MAKKALADGTAMELKRQAASRVSYDNTQRHVRTAPGAGKFGGLPNGPSGGTMSGGPKRRPGRMGG